MILDSFTSYIDLQGLDNKDIDKMRTEFAARTVTTGKIKFGTIRTKYIKSLVNWIMDFYRVSAPPSIVGLNKETFKASLREAGVMDGIRKSLKGQALPNAADPGFLKAEKHWKEWEERFVNYTRCHIGALGVPLSYVIRENNEADVTGTHPDFINKKIACAPLSGEYFDADKIAVFNMLVSFTTGQPSGDWIKTTLRYSNGRRSMKALRTHFAGEGNASRTLADADRLKETLHYKNERAMTFETFLTNLQKMFNIYDKEEEEVPEDQQVRILFNKIKSKDLESAVNALKAQATTGTNITYTMATNHLSEEVSQLPEYLSRQRNISGVRSGGTGAEDGAYHADGTVKTGYIPNWRSLSNEDKQAVLAERQRLGIKPRGKASKPGKGKADSSTVDNTIKQLRAQNQKQKRTIKALKTSSQEADKEDDDDANDDAGDSFGGKATRKKSKKT